MVLFVLFICRAFHVPHSDGHSVLMALPTLVKLRFDHSGSFVRLLGRMSLELSTRVKRRVRSSMMSKRWSSISTRSRTPRFVRAPYDCSYLAW